MRHEGMRREDARTESENMARTTASDLKTVAEDMLRMGRHWARAAQGWLEHAGDQTQRRPYPRSDDAGLRQSRDYGVRDYRGVGPRDYTRSDERIREDLNERLTEACDLDASGITVAVENGVATLNGRVPQRWMKHRAEDLADACIGVSDVRNGILVGDAPPATGTTSTGRSTNAGTSTGQAGSVGRESP